MILRGGLKLSYSPDANIKLINRVRLSEKLTKISLGPLGSLLPIFGESLTFAVANRAESGLNLIIPPLALPEISVEACDSDSSISNHRGGSHPPFLHSVVTLMQN